MIIHFLSFCHWLTLPSIMSSRFVNVAVYYIIFPFSRLNNIPLCAYRQHSVYLSTLCTLGQLAHFGYCEINAALNVGVQTCHQSPVCSSSENIPRGGTAGSGGNATSSFLRNHHGGSCTVSHSRPQRTELWSLHDLPDTCYLLVFILDSRHLHGCEGLCLCTLIAL